MATIIGTNGHDTLTGTSTADDIYGAGGHDTLFGGDGNDSLFGGAGSDSLDGGNGNDTLDGGANNDTLIGGSGDDQFLLTGKFGSDQIFGGSTGETSGDLVNASALTSGVTLNFTGSEAGSITEGSNTATFSDIERFTLTGLDDVVTGAASTSTITLDAGAGNDSVTTGSGADSLVGGSGNDTIDAGSDNDTLDGGIGNDSLYGNSGDVAVQDLRVSDLIVTRDHGLQPLRWIGRRDLSIADLIVQPALGPVRIAAGALGAGLPVRDMMVSPQHRMLVEGYRAEMLFGEDEVLVAATHLTALDGITQVMPYGVSYLHLLFDAHEIVLADGAWSESFQPAVRTLDAMDAGQRGEIAAIFPEMLDQVAAFPAARRALKAHEARVLLAA